MASSQASNTQTANQKPHNAQTVSRKAPTLGAALARSAALIYKFLKPKTARSDSEHLLFTKVISVIKLIPPTEKAALLAERETQATKKPLTPTPREVEEFEKLRNTFFNRSPRQLSRTPSPLAKPVSPMATPAKQAKSASPSPSTKARGGPQFTQTQTEEPESLENVYDDLVMTINTNQRPTIGFGSLTAPVTAAMAAMNTLTSHLVYPYTGFEGVISSTKELSQRLPLQDSLSGKTSDNTLTETTQKMPEITSPTIAAPPQKNFPPPQQPPQPPPPQQPLQPPPHQQPPLRHQSSYPSTSHTPHQLDSIGGVKHHDNNETRQQNLLPHLLHAQRQTSHKRGTSKLQRRSHPAPQHHTPSSPPTFNPPPYRTPLLFSEQRHTTWETMSPEELKNLINEAVSAAFNARAGAPADDDATHVRAKARKAELAAKKTAIDNEMQAIADDTWAGPWDASSPQPAQAQNQIAPFSTNQN